MEIQTRELDNTVDILVAHRNAAEKRALDAEQSNLICGDVLRASEARAAAANKMAVEMRIALARKDGYIDRVRETDAGAITTAVRNPMPDFLDDVRDAMAQVDEGTFDRMVGSMSQETLNKVLGKTDD